MCILNTFLDRYLSGTLDIPLGSNFFEVLSQKSTTSPLLIQTYQHGNKLILNSSEKKIKWYKLYNKVLSTNESYKTKPHFKLFIDSPTIYYQGIKLS